MTDPNPQQPPAEPDPNAPTDPPAPGSQEQPPPEQPHPGEAQLRDEGKRALEAMKSERNTARTERDEAKRQLAELQAKIDGREAEHQAETEQRRRDGEALAKANVRIASASLRAAAAGKLADPGDAAKWIDPKTIEVDDDGNVDEPALAAQIDDLIKTKPYLAAQGGKRFEGSGDGGPRKADQRPSQLTREDLKTMSPAAIVQAEKDGRLQDLMNRK